MKALHLDLLVSCPIQQDNVNVTGISKLLVKAMPLVVAPVVVVLLACKSQEIALLEQPLLEDALVLVCERLHELVLGHG
jgi:hypothetical protein